MVALSTGKWGWIFAKCTATDIITVLKVIILFNNLGTRPHLKPLAHFMTHWEQQPNQILHKSMLSFTS